MSKLFKGLAAWFDSPKGSKFALVLAKILVVDVIVLDILIAALITANLMGAFEFNTTDQNLAISAFLLLAVAVSIGAFWMLDASRNDYQRSLQRASKAKNSSL